jgi:glutamine amidotransferase
MCRWFVYIGEEPALLEDILIKPQHSIVKQISTHFLPNLHITYDPRLHRKVFNAGIASDERNSNHLTNVDGFGVGYYTGVAAEFNHDSVNRPCVYRNIRPPLNDLNLRSLCAHTATTCVFAHIRASAGITSPVETNNHPFVFGRYMFMHNGDVGNFSEIKINLLQKLSNKAHRNIFGTTDTEHCAALFFTHLGDDWESEVPLETLKETMNTTIKDLLTLIEENAASSDEDHSHSSLNFAITDGSQVLAVRYSSLDSCDPPSLYYSTKAGPTLNRKYPDHPDGKLIKKMVKRETEHHGKHVIVASEPNTYKANDWHLVPPNSFVLIDKNLNVSCEDIVLSK